MPLIVPFPGLRPAKGRADDVVAPPYDVMNAAEAREMVAGRPWSFLHISRPEVDLPEGTDPYAPEVYAKAAANLKAMRDQGVLEQDSTPCFYIYRLTVGEHTQTGIVAAASVADYDSNRIRRHEYTRPLKEDDRVRQIESLGAQTGPVFLVYRADPELSRVFAEMSEGPAATDVTAADGVRHQLWLVSDTSVIDWLSERFNDMASLYVADGHHRSAAASRVAAKRNGEDPGAVIGEQPHDYFLSVIFPHDEVRILGYNRVVHDLNGLAVDEFLDSLMERFEVSANSEPVSPKASGEFGMYLSGQWYLLRIMSERQPADDEPVHKLDVSILTRELLEPILGIGDQRSDNRIDFVGGIRGLHALEQRVDSGEMAVAFSIYPTSMSSLMAVADAEDVMPPKSTWFEPKLADGLISHLI